MKLPAIAAGELGLSPSEAAARLRSEGPNELPRSRPRGLLRLLAGILAEPMFLLLAACGAVYLLLGDGAEALMLLGFVLVEVAFSFVQLRRTEGALDALRDLSSPRALVVRGGQAERIAGRDVVVGDIVLLEEGDRVPADLELLAACNLDIDESMLTGESQPASKQARAAGEGGLAYAGTLVTRGSACGRVLATGACSALGRIGAALAQTEEQATPVQQETRRVVQLVAAGGAGLSVLLALSYGLLHGAWLQGLLAGLTLAMAILPEELPVILSLFLGLGAWRLGREQVLARSIPAIELLGATTVLCVDKTGTLTENRMTLRRLWTPVAAYDAAGAEHAAPLAEKLHGVLEYAVLASHRQAFDPMERAIIGAGQRLLADTEHLHSDWTLVDDYPLSRELLAMSRVWQSPDRAEYMIAAKGAPEAILDLCHADAATIAQVSAKVAAMASAGLRVLGVAQATFPAVALPGKQHDFDFVFLGLVALEDPVRPEVPQAIAECQRAGIRVVMITGDHLATALSIARQAGLAADGEPVTGAALDGMDDQALAARLAQARIFCRVRPEQKLRLVQGLRQRGDIVAMTGDGVNDATALKAAHIGVAMGARGSDVAREAAALVLLRDDFSSLLAAVRQGRRVFANLRKAIVFVVAVHVPIVGLSLLPVALGWPMLLAPVHVLFLQLIIDPACSLVFEAEAQEDDAMSAPPRAPQARLFEPILLRRGLAQGVGVLLLLLAVFATARSLGASDEAARAVSFAALVLCNLVLIQQNRRWGARAAAGGEGGRKFGLMALGVIGLLAVALWAPQGSRLFGFAAPPAPLLLLAPGATAQRRNGAGHGLVRRRQAHAARTQGGLGPLRRLRRLKWRTLAPQHTQVRPLVRGALS